MKAIEFNNLDLWWILFFVIALIVLMIRTGQLRTKILQRLGVLGIRDGYRRPLNRSLKNTLYIVGIFFAIIALLRPLWGQKEHQNHIEGLDICFAVDISNSMLAEDISPNRLQQVKNQMSLFLPRLGGDRAALVAFAGSSYVAAPLSVDHHSLISYLDILEPSFITQQGTDLSSAIDSCYSAFGIKDSEDAPILDSSAKVTVLITDGDETAEETSSVVERAKKLGVSIFAMAVGTEQGARIPRRDETSRIQGYLEDPDTGEAFVAKLQVKKLKEIAEQTDGKIFYASAGVAAWQDFERAIANFKRDSKEAGKRLDKEERFQFPLLLAILLLLLDFFLPETSIRQERRKAMQILFFPFLLAGIHTQAGEVDSIYYNNKAVRAFRKSDGAMAAQNFGEALARDASNRRIRLHWATTKLFSSVEGVGKDPEKKVNEQLLSESIRELQGLETEAAQAQDTAFLQELRYQLGHAFEIKNAIPDALKNYYNSLNGPSQDLQKKASVNITRLLTQQESDKSKQQQQGEGEGGGSQNQDQQEGKDDSKDGKSKEQKPQDGGNSSQKKAPPKFSGTEISEEQAKKIMQSVSGEEKGVLRRKAREEAKKQSRKQGDDSADDIGNSKPW